MRLATAVLGMSLVLLAGPSAAGADIGALSSIGASDETGLESAWDVAVSPDGKSVYVVGNGGDAIAIFARNASTGVLTPQGCIADTGLLGCAQTTQGLNGPTGVVVSPDGKSVYVSSEADHAVVHFDRDDEDGDLTPVGCVEDLDGVAGCGSEQQGLLQANDLAISADGKSLYVVSRGDHALVRFNRTLDTGGLSAQSCYADVGVTHCGPVTEVEGLGDAQAVAVSSDGKSVYVVSRNEAAIVRFDRTEAGALTAQGCIADVGALTSCAGTQQGLGGARDIAVSSDGKSVYVASQADSAVARLDRGTNGALTPQGCVQDLGGSAGCAGILDGLQHAYGVAVSPDGKSVYAVGANDHAVARFDRSPVGALTPRSKYTAVGLGFPHRIAVSPDGKSVYVPSTGNGNIFGFFRSTTASSTPPITPPVTLPPPAPPTRPSNDFDIESVFAPKRNGTVTYEVDLPGGGTILVHAEGEITGPPRAYPSAKGKKKRKKAVTVARAKVTAKRAGRVKVKLVPNRKAKKYLKRYGKLKAKITLTFTPTGGKPRSVVRRVTFRLKKPR